VVNRCCRIAGAHNFNLEKDCVGAGGAGLGLGTRVPLPPGRITGSASIETLVRVGIEKENGLSPDSKMVIVHDFTPCVDDELQVKRGQVRGQGSAAVLFNLFVFLFLLLLLQITSITSDT
jgi:hypothetical protein